MSTSNARGNPAPRAPRMQAGDSPYERLKAAVLSGELPPGTPLVESSLAKWLGVSRTPVREALTRLHQDALLSRDGVRNVLVVRERSPGDILDIYDTRIVLEAAAARAAAERRTSNDLILLTRNVRAWEQTDRSDEQAMVDVNRNFHRAVWNASQNESLIDLLTRLDLHVAKLPATTLKFPGRWTQAGQEHAALVAAIERRDVEQAGEIAERHFTTARDIRVRLWEEI